MQLVPFLLLLKVRSVETSVSGIELCANVDHVLFFIFVVSDVSNSINNINSIAYCFVNYVVKRML